MLLWVAFSGLQGQAQSADKLASLEATVSLEAGTERRLPDSVIYVVGWEDAKDLGRGASPVVIGQKNKTFLPDVTAVLRGSQVVFANQDTVRHNVFSVSPARAFDLGHAAPGDEAPLSFQKTGVVDVYCNIHPEMVASIVVLPNRAFSVVPSPETSRQVTVTIPGIQPGKWAVHLWNRQAPPLKQELDFPQGGRVKVKFVLKPRSKMEPHLDKHGKPYAPRKGYPPS